jgi:uncharacterized protein with PQ loop repeat
MLGIMSAVAMLSTVPQVLKVWTQPSASGVSKSMYLACIGWILLDAAIVIGLVARTP